MGISSERVIERLGPLIDSVDGEALIDGIVGGLDPYAAIAEDDRGIGVLLDPADCPAFALDWLGQITGAGDMSTLDEAGKRYRIDSLPRHKRGRIETIVAAMQTELTGDKTVWVQERYQGSPYKLLLVTRTSETPDAARALAAAKLATPAGRQITHTVVTGQTYAEAAAAAATYATATGLWATYSAAQNG